MNALMRRTIQVLRLAAKEWQLLLRNPHGLAAVFLMPAAFVLVMSFTLKNTLVARVELPRAGWVVEEAGRAAAQWAGEWLSRHDGERYATRDALLAALKSRRVEAGVIVRSPWLDETGRPRGDQIEIWLGSRVQPAAAARLRAELRYATFQAGLKMAAAEAGAFASALLDGEANAELLSTDQAPAIRYLYEIESGHPMTAVQQSVPAWLVFGMFFVVIPIAGVLIQERNDGTLNRLAGFGVRPSTLLGGKLAAYMLLNWVQLGFMLLVGRWVVPALGGDALHLDVELGWFFLMVSATSAAAVGLALAISAWSSGFDQAAALGGGLNVVLAAVAGVMVPRVLMPSNLQLLSEASPMGWALDGMQAVFLGDPDAAFILPRVSLLLGLGGLCLLLSGLRLRRLQARD
jgi:ABC-2 type transport system permease protein